MDDERYMRDALRLARRGLGRTSPNPMVGAVITRDGVVIGRGYHRRFGGKHAEVNAIEDAGGDVRGGTLYVTLEPCCHTNKKTPPCLNALLERGLSRVVIGSLDPNPEVNGQSVEKLREQGIETVVGVLEGDCRRLNEVYFKFIRTGRPFVTVKFAQTLDGRVASATGDSKWISSLPSLRLAHRLRSRHDAVLVGIGTVLADDPQLTVRLTRGRNPVRVVIDSKLRIPSGSKVLAVRDSVATIVSTTAGAGTDRRSVLEQMGVRVLVVDANAEGQVDLDDLLGKLGGMNISSVLVEGGATVVTSFVRRRLVDRVVAIVAPRLMGRGIESIGDLGVLKIDEAVRMSFDRMYRSGDDLVVEAVASR